MIGRSLMTSGSIGLEADAAAVDAGTHMVLWR